MDALTYKEKKFDKLTRDMLQLVNRVPSFGYGESVDLMANTVMTSHLLTVINIAEMQAVDIEILAQSLCDELKILSDRVVTEINVYQNDLEVNS